jgi:aryl-alcohol dehydrogenase-like predicted oxidoreductase
VMGCDNQQTLAHASAMFDHFFAAGGNTFDTGYIYGGGLQERLLGRWIANRAIRDEVAIIVKGAHTPHCDPESISRQLTESLERLGTDHADLYFMHRDNTEIAVEEFVDVLDAEVRAGRVRAFGGSNWSPVRIDAANAYAERTGKHGFSLLSNHFGLAEAYDVPWTGCEHVTDAESKRWLTERQIPLFPWSSQARGFFTGRAQAEDRSDAELVRCYYSDENFERLRRATQLGTELGVAPTAIALAYVLNQPFPTFPLFGPRTIAETSSSMAGLAVELRPDQVAWLDLRGERQPV